MDLWVDPAADEIWGAVGVVESGQNVRDVRPRGPADWERLRQAAAVLSRGASLLAEAPPVGSNGHGLLADADTPGIRTADEIQADIRRDPARFRRAAAALGSAAGEASAAIDARDPDALLEAGGRIDAACEGCHSAYWYPRSPPRTLPSLESFARLGSGAADAGPNPRAPGS